MMEESELRRRFGQLREADRNRAPSFAQIYARARTREGLRTTMRMRPFAIGAAAAVVIAAIWIAQTRPFSTDKVAPAIATWRAPTDLLLETPGTELLRAMPALGASVLDKMIPTPSNRGS
jgi:hypothetical protein